MVRVLLTVAILASAFFSLSAQAEPIQAFEGRKVYNTYCFVCHGIAGKGDGPLAEKLSTRPRSLLREEVQDYSDEQLRRMTKGTWPYKLAKDMPEFGNTLPVPALNAVMAYIRFLQRSEHPLMGDPELGRAVYEQYCMVCHGAMGKGDGVLSQLMPLRAANHSDGDNFSRISNDKLVQAILKGGSADSYMPAWQGVLSQQEVESVVSYIRLLAVQ